MDNSNSNNNIVAFVATGRLKENKMKCPLCKKGTVKEYTDPPYFVCSNEYCPSYSDNDYTCYDMLMKATKLVKKLRKKNRVLTVSVSEYFNRWMNVNIEAIKLRDYVKHYQEQETARHQLEIDKIKGEQQ